MLMKLKQLMTAAAMTVVIGMMPAFASAGTCGIIWECRPRVTANDLGTAVFCTPVSVILANTTVKSVCYMLWKCHNFVSLKKA